MSEFVITDIKDASFSKDRTEFTVGLTTSGDTLAIKLTPNLLERLITRLQELEYHASLLDPAHGPAGDEPGIGRVEVVNKFLVGHGQIKGLPSLVVRFRSAEVSRTFSLEKNLAQKLLNEMAAEFPNVQKNPKLN